VGQLYPALPWLCHFGICESWEDHRTNMPWGWGEATPAFPDCRRLLGCEVAGPRESGALRGPPGSCLRTQIGQIGDLLRETVRMRESGRREKFAGLGLCWNLGIRARIPGVRNTTTGLELLSEAQTPGVHSGRPTVHSWESRQAFCHMQCMGDSVRPAGVPAAGGKSPKGSWPFGTCHVRAGRLWLFVR
jgi:hypothetical protein